MKSLRRGPSIYPSLLTSPRRPRTSFPLQPDSNFETYTNYCGFPSRPIFIYHAWVPWPRLTEPEVYRVPKESRPICKHPITAVWRQIGQRIYGYLDRIKVKWTLVDPVRFAEVGDTAGPLSLWIGVMPLSLSRWPHRSEGRQVDRLTKPQPALLTTKLWDIHRV